MIVQRAYPVHGLQLLAWQAYAMDQFYQVMYGPNEDKLKHSGSAWLAISLLANVAGSNVTGFVGLLAILAVVAKSEYLLFLVRHRGYWRESSSTHLRIKRPYALDCIAVHSMPRFGKKNFTVRLRLLLTPCSF